MNACPLLETYAANTPIWQLVILPAEPVYWRPTPHEAWPCFRKPVSSMTSTASGSARVSTTSSRTRSRNASASHRLRSRSACWRQGPGSPAASARIHPVLRRSGPSRTSRNSPAAVAVRSCRNKGLIRSLTLRNDDAHSSSVASTDPAAIHDLRIMVTQMAISRKNHNCSASRLGTEEAFALALPRADAGTMGVFLHYFSDQLAPKVHAVLILDQAGWHDERALRVPRNVTLLPLPTASPE